MRITLITDFMALPRWNQALDQAIHRWGPPPIPVVLWVRHLPSSSPAGLWQGLRQIQAQHHLGLEYSWPHREQAPPAGTVHIPDAPALREESQGWSGTRILSVHGIDDAAHALQANDQDEVLLAPWRQPISKTHRGDTVDHHAVKALANEHPERVHIVGGLTPKDYHEFSDQGFASMALLGAFTASPTACWRALTQIS